MATSDALTRRVKRLQAMLAEPPTISIRCVWGDEQIDDEHALVIKTHWTTGALEEDGHEQY